MTAYINLKEYVAGHGQGRDPARQGREAHGMTATTDNGKKKLPSLLFKPESVTKDNISETVIKDGTLKREDICAGRIERYCEEAGSRPARGRW